MCENVETLIEFVRGYPILYDVRNKDYKDISRKADIWEEIAIKMHLENGTVAKNKWRHLRDSYAKYLRSQSTAVGHSNKKYKHWTWASQMEFLKPHVTSRQTDVSSTGNHSESDTDTRIKLEPSFEEFAPYYDDSQIDKTAMTSKKGKAQGSSNVTDLSDEAMIDYSQTEKLQRSMDAVDLLFLSYAQTLKTFSPRRRIMVKLQIAQIMNNAEIAQLEERDQSRLSSSPSPSS